MTLISKKTTKQVVLIRTALYWTCRLLVGLSFLYVSWKYRYEPVFVLKPDVIPVWFIGKIIAFPTGVVGNVGCIFWICMCQSALWGVVKCMGSSSVV